MNLAQPFPLPPRWLVAAAGLACAVGLAVSGCSGKSSSPITARGADAAARDARDGAASVSGDAPTRSDGGDGYVRPMVGSCATVPTVKRPLGQSCSCHDECGSGSCVDGVCCSSSCSGPCMACNLAGTAGQCSPVPDGLAPVLPTQCAREPAATCGLDGLCNGRGGCRRYPDGTLCEPGRCQGSSLAGAKLCSGGACSAPVTVTCSPYGCDPAANRCHARCTDSSQCAGALCRDGSCGKKPAGAVCDSAAECDSGACTDGVCCNSACSGPCLSCREPGRLGQCSPVPAGHIDPRGQCQRQAAETCGQTGVCDGQGACARYPAGTMCRREDCSGASFAPPSVCDGVGSCVPSGPISCAPFTCQAGACRASCGTSAECINPSSCQAGSCGKRGLGQRCASSAECQSNQCVDGVCCDSPCTGKCVSCSRPEALGRCVNVPAGVADPRAAAGETDPARVCIDEGVEACSGNGRCDGQGGCQNYPNGAICQPESCDPAANRYAVGTCRNGTCTVSSRSCAPNRCNGRRCGQRCSDDAQCATPSVCQKGSCGKKPNGEPCAESNPDECASGICAQGVCCAGPCAGSCVSCALPQSAGVCTPVTAGAPDPARACADGGPAACKGDGLCDGRGRCRNYPLGTVCASAACSNGVARRASRCDGAGACVAGASEACAPIVVCDQPGVACEKTCTADSQCVSGTKCFEGRCGLLEAGKACTGNGDCKSSFCVDGVCCDRACGGNNQNDCLACSREAGAAGDGRCGPRTGGSSCSDGNACTTSDACSGETCSGVAVVCTAKSACHDAGSCDPVSGRCTTPLRSNGTVCDDANPCTTGDSCSNGVCGGSAVVCPAAAPCAVSACDAATGMCASQPRPDGTTCSDGSACTRSDSCQRGVCLGGDPVVCSGGACQEAGVCDAATGLCPSVSKADGTLCEDGNRCTLEDRCAAGACLPGPPKSCVTGNVCQTAGTCDPTDGQCKGGTARPDGTTCDDDNRCTTGDTCTRGLCAGASVACPAAVTCRGASSCDPLTGSCRPGEPRNLGAACDDGARCTQSDVCRADGECRGDPLVCPPATACLAASACDPQSGVCAERTPRNEGGACDDGSLCTEGDLCTQGTCAGRAKACSASNTCVGPGVCDQTTGLCSPGPFLEGASCSDGNACTENDSCSGGTCRGSPRSCGISVCHAPGACDTTSGACMPGAPLTGVECDDNDLCTIASVCAVGVCLGTIRKDCSDSDPCTEDTCEGGGCGHKPIPGCSPDAGAADGP
jgi:hypothetical protein